MIADRVVNRADYDMRQRDVTGLAKLRVDRERLLAEFQAALVRARVLVDLRDRPQSSRLGPAIARGPETVERALVVLDGLGEARRVVVRAAKADCTLASRPGSCALDSFRSGL